MKKMILLLILPLTALMAIEFVMTRDGLVDAKDFTTTTPTPSAPSTYLETVNLPACDASNPEVQFINKNSDWDNINSSGKRIFCVSPGDYTALGNISLTRSGTADKKRYIILNNGNDIHPGKLDESDLANFALRFTKASYWIIDRWAAFNTQVKSGIILSSGATYNIINRGFTNNYTRAIDIKDQAHNNTIQKSRFQNMKPVAMDLDGVAINIIAWGLDSFVIKNTKIINNEIVTSNDGIQITRSPKNSDPGGYYQKGNAEGTIIDSNHIWQDPSTVDYGQAENAIDIKVGSDNPNNPIIITNNHIWNWNKAGGTESGSATVFHYTVKNTKINNNVFFNSGQSLGSGSNGPSSGFNKGLVDSEFTGNLIYEMKIQTGKEYAIMGSSMRGTDIHNNTFINCTSRKGKFNYSEQGSFFRNNILINSTGTYNTQGSSSEFINSLKTNTEYASSETAGYSQDYSFTTDNFTDNPKIITLKNALKP